VWQHSQLVEKRLLINATVGIKGQPKRALKVWSLYRIILITEYHNSFRFNAIITIGNPVQNYPFLLLIFSILSSSLLTRSTILIIPKRSDSARSTMVSRFACHELLMEYLTALTTQGLVTRPVKVCMNTNSIGNNSSAVCFGTNL
jgi:hypothetical protein